MFSSKINENSESHRSTTYPSIFSLCALFQFLYCCCGIFDILLCLDLAVICVESLCQFSIHMRYKKSSKEGKDKEVGGSGFNYKGYVRDFLELLDM